MSTTTTERIRAEIDEIPHIPGEEGVWVFIFGDMLVFAVLFGTFMYYRSEKPAVFADSQGALNQNFGAANTVVLLISSLLVLLAVRAVRMKLPFAPLLVAGAFACGLIFSTLKIVE